jgi:hypothetical protein
MQTAIPDPRIQVSVFFIIDIEPIDFMDTFAYLSARCNSYLNALLRPALREGVSGRLL